MKLINISNSNQAAILRVKCICLLLLTLAISGCTEMRVEGDAKVFQSSAVGSIIRTVLGLGLIGLGITGVIGSVMPDRKPKNGTATSKERTPTGMRLGIALFGFTMGSMGLFLAGAPLLFPSKLHVTVFPDRVAMASTYSQTGDKEVVIPFAGLSSVELRDERNVVGKSKTFLVFTQKGGRIIKQDAGNNERQALETIRQALAEYQKSAPANKNSVASAAPTTSTDNTRARNEPTPNSQAVPQNNLSQPQATPLDKEYQLKRYDITTSIPEGYRLVETADTFEAGTKLKASWGNNWYNVTIVAFNGDGTITCNWDDFPTSTYKMVREDLITVDKKASSNTTATNGSRPPVVLPTASPQESSPQYSLKRYKITIPIPTGYAIVAENVDVESGSKLRACYAGRWEYVTVVAVNEDGTITCNWDNWKSFTYKMMRDDLIMAK